MAIELTSASKSTRLAILTALNAGITGIPYLDGIPVDGIVIYTNEATEGTSVPDANGATFTKTYNLGRAVTSGYLVFPPSGQNFLNFIPGALSPILLNALSFPALSAEPSYATGVNGIDVMRNDIYASPPYSGNLIYVSSDYTQSRRFVGSGFFERNPNTDQPLTVTSLGNTYTGLGNFLVGYYLAPFGGTQSFVEIAEGGASGTHRKASLIAAYFSGTNLILNLKKNEASTNATMLRAGILVLPD